MKKSKIIIIIIIILLILLMGLGGVFAYTYFSTDLFKSDKEMFFSYLGQIADKENGFIDSNLIKLSEKKKENAYKNSGQLTVSVELPEEMKNGLEDVSNSDIRREEMNMTTRYIKSCFKGVQEQKKDEQMKK